MSEITVKELMDMVGSGVYRAESVDRYDIFIRMEQINFMYDEDRDELILLSSAPGNVASEVAFNVGSSIEYIGVGADGMIMIEFNPQVSVIEIRKVHKKERY